MMRLPGAVEFLEFLVASDVAEEELGVLPGTYTQAIEAITRVGGETWAEMVFNLIMDETYPNIYLFIGYALGEWQRHDRLRFSEVADRLETRHGIQVTQRIDVENEQ